MQPEEQTLIDIWYAGLNEAFRKTRGPLGAAGCHDHPPIRIFYYGVAALALTSMGVGSIFVIFFLKGVIWLGGICAVVAFITLFQAVTFFNALIKVKRAVARGENTDAADPLRFKVMRRALSWGLKKGVVIRNSEGKYQMKRDRKNGDRGPRADRKRASLPEGRSS